MDIDGKTRAKRWVLALTSLASFMVALDALVVTTALTVMARDLRASVAGMQWTVNAYNLSFAVLLLTGAAVGDRLGRRRMFAGGIALFAAASIACALASSVDVLIAARAVQGAGAALVMPLAMALVSTAYDRNERPRALGIFGGVTGLALLAGPVVGGAIAQGFAWQWIFWVNVPLAAAIIPLGLHRIGESHGPSARLDGMGILIVTLSAFGLVWGLMRGKTAGWESGEVMSAIVGGLLLALAFVWWERRVAEPMVPLRLFASKAFLAGIASAFLFYAAMYGVLFLLPQFLQTTLDYGVLEAGLRLLPWTATLFVFAPLGGTLVKTYGERTLVVGGLAAQALGMAWIGVIAGSAASYQKLILPLLIAGAGVSLAMPAAQSAVMGAVTPQDIGKASGTFNMLRYLGGVFGIALLVAILQATGGEASAEAFGTGFAGGMIAAAALSALGALIACALPGRAHLGAMKLADEQR
jgi:EmrB/QacA subfamily drug resistance transporter